MFVIDHRIEKQRHSVYLCLCWVGSWLLVLERGRERERERETESERGVCVRCWGLGKSSENE